MAGIGISQKRIDAFGKVKGSALYPGDFYYKDQLIMKVLFARRPHAVVKSIEIVEASRTPGVVRILTAKDVPNNEYGLISPDQPVLCGPGSNKTFGDRVRFIGDQVALIIAEDECSAKIARDLIKVEYEDLPVVENAIEASRQEAVLVHPDKKSNVFCTYKIRKGNVESAFAHSDVIIEAVYTTPVQEHAYLQPEAGVGYLDDEGRITIIVGGQWTHEDQEQVAHSLNIPLDQVRIIYPAIGGAFGGREDMSVQIILALAVYKLREVGITRPVKIIWSREESIIGHHKRHAYSIRAKWGATKEGKLLAAEVGITADGGAYMYTSTKVLANATLMCTGPYNIPNVSVDSKAVYTNNIPGGAFRGFGGPQGAFAAESQMNKLAQKLGFDPVELRKNNLLNDGETLSVGTPLPEGVSIDKVVENCATTAGWTRKENGRLAKPQIISDSKNLRGIGFACAYKNVGFSFGAPENCWAIIELHGTNKIDSVVLRHAGAEVGQGAHTVFVQMASQALGVSESIVKLVSSDTSVTNNSGSVSASRMTFMAGNAIIGAAGLALEKWKNEERPAIAEYQYFAPKTTPFDPETGECTPNFAYGYVAEAVECEIDAGTGKINVLRVVCTDDVGNAINPNLVEGQIEGAITQAFGYAVTENLIQKQGLTLTDKFSTYLIPTVLDIPIKVESVILENPEKRGPFGVRGMGEMPFLPFAPALIAAVHDATGVWFNEFPLTPERVYFGLKTKCKDEI